MKFGHEIDGYVFFALDDDSGVVYRWWRNEQGDVLRTSIDDLPAVTDDDEGNDEEE